MAIFKISIFILCYFFARVAISATCETFIQNDVTHLLCWDQDNGAWVSEKCMTKECDAKKFLNQYKASKSKVKASTPVTGPTKACLELQRPLIKLRDVRGAEASYCVFNDGSIIDAAVVERVAF